MPSASASSTSGATASTTAGRLIVDGANVVGATPDGWWRDRPGAAARLHQRLLERGDPCTLVLEGQARSGVPAGTQGSVETVHAPGEGDDTIAGLAGPGTTVVTSDRALAARCRAAGAEVVGPGSAGLAGGGAGSRRRR
jgi:hypothetical protein